MSNKTKVKSDWWRRDDNKKHLEAQMARNKRIGRWEHLKDNWYEERLLKNKSKEKTNWKK